MPHESLAFRILNLSLNGNSDIMSIRCECLYLDINSGGTVPTDRVVEVIPQFKTGHKGSWALRASVKHCCSSIKSWTSFLSMLFSCSRHSYSWLHKISVCQKPHQSHGVFSPTIVNICLYEAKKKKKKKVNLQFISKKKKSLNQHILHSIK